MEVDYRLSGCTGLARADRPVPPLLPRVPGSLPPRDYELAARLLATAIEQMGRRSPGDTVERVARDFGRALGQDWRERLGPRAGRRRQLSAIHQVLSRHGFEPYDEEGEVRLRNCPFHSLAREHTALACGMNLALMERLVAELKAAGVRAPLDPRPDQCCVVLGPSGRHHG